MTMSPAIALIRGKVKSRATLENVLAEQEIKRKAHGESAYTIYYDNNDRFDCYVFLQWASHLSLSQFLMSPTAKLLVDEWPFEGEADIKELRQLS